MKLEVLEQTYIDKLMLISDASFHFCIQIKDKQYVK